MIFYIRKQLPSTYFLFPFLFKKRTNHKIFYHIRIRHAIYINCRRPAKIRNTKWILHDITASFKHRFQKSIIFIKIPCKTPFYFLIPAIYYLHISPSFPAYFVYNSLSIFYKNTLLVLRNFFFFIPAFLS